MSEIFKQFCISFNLADFHVQVHAAFKVLDSDRDGFVTKSDFKKKFQNLNSQQIDIVFQR